MLNTISTNVWRLIVAGIVTGLLSIGGWIFTEVRSLPATYETVKKHDIDTKELRQEIMEQQTRIEGKIDETNQFLRNYFANSNNNP